MANHCPRRLTLSIEVHLKGILYDLNVLLDIVLIKEKTVLREDFKRV